LDGARGLEVGVDVLYSGFVEGGVGFAEGEEIGGEVGLGGLPGGENEGRGEG
jgi:hypothetical protein